LPPLDDPQDYLVAIAGTHIWPTATPATANSTDFSRLSAYSKTPSGR
jgi:hypothetical protein